MSTFAELMEAEALKLKERYLLLENQLESSVFKELVDHDSSQVADEIMKNKYHLGREKAKLLASRTTIHFGGYDSIHNVYHVLNQCADELADYFAQHSLDTGGSSVRVRKRKAQSDVKDSFVYHVHQAMLEAEESCRKLIQFALISRLEQLQYPEAEVSADGTQEICGEAVEA